MKKLILTLAFLAVSLPAMATGMKMEIFECHSMINGPSIELATFSTSAPGGPVNTWTEFTVGGVGADPIGKSFRVEQVFNATHGDTSLIKYKTKSGGTLDVIFMGERIFIDANLKGYSTNGMSELTTRYNFCRIH